MNVVIAPNAMIGEQRNCFEKVHPGPTFRDGLDVWTAGVGGACGWEGKGVGVGCEGMGGVLAQLFVLEPLIAPTEGLRQLRSEFLVLGLYPFNWLGSYPFPHANGRNCASSRGIRFVSHVEVGQPRPGIGRTAT